MDCPSSSPDSFYSAKSSVALGKHDRNPVQNLDGAATQPNMSSHVQRNSAFSPVSASFNRSQMPIQQGNSYHGTLSYGVPSSSSMANVNFHTGSVMASAPHLQANNSHCMTQQRQDNGFIAVPRPTLPYPPAQVQQYAFNHPVPFGTPSGSHAPLPIVYNQYQQQLIPQQQQQPQEQQHSGVNAPPGFGTIK